MDGCPWSAASQGEKTVSCPRIVEGASGAGVNTLPGRRGARVRCTPRRRTPRPFQLAARDFILPIIAAISGGIASRPIFSIRNELLMISFIDESM